jgi:hypothetical protein|tara:strand:+ start:664 stop:978 length:315 start_codon:yes stop_codon:yes gene_type:complete
MNFEAVEKDVISWHYARNLIEGSSDIQQFEGKLLEEVEELRMELQFAQSPVDSIGDIMVVLCNIATRNGLTLTECFSHAYGDIEHRKGRMENGVFVKELVDQSK